MIALTNPTSSWFVSSCASGFFGSKWGKLLYAEIRLWVAKLITCARQLKRHQSEEMTKGLIRKAHLIFRCWGLYTLLLMAVKCLANSRIMVELLDALSQVTWPI